jgi:hypothetical protein
MHHKLLLFTIPKPKGKLTKVYMAHGQFTVMDSTQMQRIPIYRPGDTNAKPTGGARQISDKLMASEAGFLFKPVGHTSF